MGTKPAFHLFRINAAMTCAVDAFALCVAAHPSIARVLAQ